MFGQNDRQTKSFFGQMVISAGHCPLTGGYGILSPVYYLERAQPNDVWGTSAENSILMKRRYQDLGSASDWSCRVGNLIQPIRRTTQIWVVTRHQYGISALVSQTSFGGETSGSVAKCRLFSQATLLVICMKNEFRSKRGKTLLLLSTISSAELPLVQFVKCWQFFLKDYQSWKRHGKILNFTWRNCTNPSSTCPIKINNKGYTLSSHPCFISIHFWHVQLLKSPFSSTQQWNYTSNVHHFGRNLILLNLHLILA